MQSRTNNNLCCFQYVKFIKFESNSQLKGRFTDSAESCFQYVNFQYVKFIKFESNSQRLNRTSPIHCVVFSMSNL